MTLSDIKYKKFRFNFNQSFQNSKQQFNYKDAIIIQAQDSQGDKHFGEVSPLDGYSMDNIEICEQKLQQLLPLNYKIDTEELISLSHDLNDYPALIYGFEQLILSTDQIKKTLIHNTKSININGLIGLDNSKNILNKAEELIKKGFKTLKIKIGRKNFDEDFELLSTLNNKYGDSVSFRLDNNGCWNLNEAEVNIDRLSIFNIEYIEEPVSDLDELLKLSEISPINIAIDESIQSYSIAKELIETSNVKYLILKPSIKIGIMDSMRLIEYANKKGVEIVISSAFESALGRWPLLYLASNVNHTLAHGLNTQLIGADIIFSKLNYGLPSINFNQASLIPSFSLDF